MLDRAVFRILLVKLEGIALLLVLDLQCLLIVGDFSVFVCFCDLLFGVAVGCRAYGNDLAVMDFKGKRRNSDLVLNAVLFFRRSSFGQAVFAVRQGGNINLAAVECQDIILDLRFSQHGDRCHFFGFLIHADGVLSAVRKCDDISTVAEAGNLELIALDCTALDIDILNRSGFIGLQKCLAVHLDMMQGVAADLIGRCAECFNGDSLIIEIIAVFIVCNGSFDSLDFLAARRERKVAEADLLIIFVQLLECKGCTVQRSAAHILFADRKCNGFIRQGNSVECLVRFILADGLDLFRLSIALDGKGLFGRKESERSFYFFNSIGTFRQTGEDHCGSDRLPAVCGRRSRHVSDQVFIILKQIICAVVLAGAVCEEELGIACLYIGKVDCLVPIVLTGQFQNCARNRHIIFIGLSDADRINRIVNRQRVFRAAVGDKYRNRLRVRSIRICNGHTGICDHDLDLVDRLIECRCFILLEDIGSIRQLAELDVFFADSPLQCLSFERKVSVRSDVLERCVILIGELHLRAGDLAAVSDSGVRIISDSTDTVAVIHLRENELVVNLLRLVRQLDGDSRAARIKLDLRIANPFRLALALVDNVADFECAGIILSDLCLYQCNRFCKGQRQCSLFRIIFRCHAFLRHGICREFMNAGIRARIEKADINAARACADLHCHSGDIFNLIARAACQLVALSVAECKPFVFFGLSRFCFDGIRGAERNGLVCIDSEVLLNIHQIALIACRNLSLYDIVCAGLKLQCICAVRQQRCAVDGCDLRECLCAALLPKLELCAGNICICFLVDLCKLDLGIVALIADHKAAVICLADIQLRPVMICGDLYTAARIDRQCCRCFAVSDFRSEVSLRSVCVISAGNDQNIICGGEITLRSLCFLNAVNI